MCNIKLRVDIGVSVNEVPYCRPPWTNWTKAKQAASTPDFCPIPSPPCPRPPKKLHGFASASKPFLVEKHAANLENTCNWDSKDSYLNENKLEEWRWSNLPWPQCAWEMQEGALKSYIDYTEEGKFL